MLLIGHRHAEIYVRDAMSGLFLRSFGSTAVTPTVYSIVINQNNLYCGTAKDNILVFAFHVRVIKPFILLQPHIIFFRAGRTTKTKNSRRRFERDKLPENLREPLVRRLLQWINLYL